MTIADRALFWNADKTAIVEGDAAAFLAVAVGHEIPADVAAVMGKPKKVAAKPADKAVAEPAADKSVKKPRAKKKVD